MIHFCDEKTGRRYTDLMEIQILELKKFVLGHGRESLLDWMQFFRGSSRKEIADICGISVDEVKTVLE